MFTGIIYQHSSGQYLFDLGRSESNFFQATTTNHIRALFSSVPMDGVLSLSLCIVSSLSPLLAKLLTQPFLLLQVLNADARPVPCDHVLGIHPQHCGCDDLQPASKRTHFISNSDNREALSISTTTLPWRGEDGGCISVYPSYTYL